ncbi:MAG: tetratricopeptide repeat protein, partial [Candidatus Zixiibacteriota bacterium]
MSDITVNMSKLVSYSLITIGLVLCLSCTDNPAVRLRYELEKNYFAVERELRDAQIRPDLTPTTVLRSIADRYGQLVETAFGFLGQIDSQLYPTEYREIQYLTFQSTSRLSQLYFSVKRYDTCVAILGRLIDRVDLQGSQRAQTMLNLGRAMQSNRQWDSALAVYDGVVNEVYPPVDDSNRLVLPVFNLPAHIVRITRMAGDSAATSKRFEMAVSHYQRLLSDYPNVSRLAVSAHAQLAWLFYEAQLWEQSIEQLAHLVDSSGSLPFGVQFRVAGIYGEKIHDYDRALDMYQTMIDSLDKR